MMLIAAECSIQSALSIADRSDTLTMQCDHVLTRKEPYPAAEAGASPHTVLKALPGRLGGGSGASLLLSLGGGPDPQLWGLKACHMWCKAAQQCQAADQATLTPATGDAAETTDIASLRRGVVWGWGCVAGVSRKEPGAVSSCHLYARRLALFTHAAVGTLSFEVLRVPYLSTHAPAHPFKHHWCCSAERHDVLRQLHVALSD
jgi:hypothetical protein